MYTVEQIKRDGMINALKERIGDLIFEIRKETWENVKNTNYLDELDEAIDKTKTIIELIQETYTALKELQDENKEKEQ